MLETNEEKKEVKTSLSFLDSTNINEKNFSITEIEFYQKIPEFENEEEKKIGYENKTSTNQQIKRIRHFSTSQKETNRFKNLEQKKDSTENQTQIKTEETKVNEKKKWIERIIPIIIGIIIVLYTREKIK